jgi:hypothetical protein
MKSWSGNLKSERFHKENFSILKKRILESPSFSYEGYFNKGLFEGHGVLKINDLENSKNSQLLSQQIIFFLSSLETPTKTFKYIGPFKRGTFFGKGSFKTEYLSSSISLNPGLYQKKAIKTSPIPKKSKIFT